MNKIEKKSACCHDAFILEDHPDSFSQQIFIEQSGLCTVLRWVDKKMLMVTALRPHIT